MKTDAIDRAFLKANSSKDGTKTTDLCRSEFIEALVRIATFKYKEAKLARTVPEAYEKMVEEVLVPFHAQHCQEGQVFRQKFLKGTIIDHIMASNKEHLDEMMMKVQRKSKSTAFTLQAATNLEA